VTITDPKQSVYIYNCSGSVVQVRTRLSVGHCAADSWLSSWRSRCCLGGSFGCVNLAPDCDVHVVCQCC
jgi:hypothetical protein